MNYKQVIEDFNNDTIDKTQWNLAIDNDDGYWDYVGDSEDYNWIEEEREKLYAKYGCPDGHRDIVDVLNAAGVPAGWC